MPLAVGMAPLQSRVNQLLHDLGLAPQETLKADASAIAAAVGLETPESVLDVVNSAERALYATDSAGRISRRKERLGKLLDLHRSTSS